MKRVVVSLRNTLLTEAVMRTLNTTGEFRCERILPDKVGDIPLVSQAKKADIVLMEVDGCAGFSMNERMTLAKRLHEERAECKVILLCDENASPQIAREVMLAKQARRVDGFFYTSVTADYLTAALESL